jgi:hypothetical protein
MQMLDISRFQDTDKCAACLMMPPGKLRSELAWENGRRFLPITHRRRVRSM